MTDYSPKLISKHLVGISTALAVATGLIGCETTRSELHELTFDPREWIGTAVPELALHSFGGEEIRPPLFDGSRPVLLYFVDEAALVNCYQLPVEIQIIARELPSIQQVFVISRSDPTAASRFAEQHRITDLVALDTQNTVAAAFQGRSLTPWILLADSEGRIILTDNRSGGSFARMPLSTVLLRLGKSLAHPAAE